MSISRKMKSLLSVIITVAMVMSFVPVTYAENAQTYQEFNNYYKKMHSFRQEYSQIPY